MGAMIILVLVIVLVVCGILGNFYLYTRGAFTDRRLIEEDGPPDRMAKRTLSREDRFYASINAKDNTTERMIRRFVIVCLATIVLFAAVLAMLINSVEH